MLKNIILDMGNVLLDYNPQVPLDAFCSSEEEKEIIWRELFCGAEWPRTDKGEIRDAELFDTVKAHVPRENWNALKRCCEEWDICMKPLAGAREFCEYVKAAGYGIYVLSNASERFYHYFERLLPLSFFDGVVVSSDIHLIKPDRKCYEYLLENYCLKAEECLFIDDRQDNVDAAKSVGMHAVRFENDFEKIKTEYL